MKATHKISAVYFPKVSEIELTWEDIKTGESAWLVAKITPKEGNQIAKIVPPCVYSGAIVNNKDCT